MNGTLDLVVQIIMLTGALIFLMGAVGVVRMPDLYTRLSAVTISGALGTGLILVGLLIYHASFENSIIIGLALIIQLATTAVGGAAMARAGYLSGAPRAEATRFDDIAVEERNDDSEEEHPGYSRPNGS